jgi:hypothetical protein
MEHEVTVRVDLPEVVETHYRTEVTCGSTSAYVYEHGHRGSGAWAVWTGEVGHIVSGGTNGYPLERALADAHLHVRREERQRLMHEQLRGLLASDDGKEPNDVR